MSFWPFVILQIVIFIGLVMALRRILSRHLTSGAAHLQGLSSEYTRRHEELKQQVTEAEQQYREQMARAKAEADHIMVQAKQEAESSKARLLEEARLEGERIVQQGMESCEVLRKEIEGRMESRALERACELIHEVLPGQLRQEIQSRWLDELIHNGLAQLEQLKTQASVRDARVVSACPLSPQQRSVLRSWLKERLGREVALTEAVDERLVIGLTITLGSLVLDGSLASRVRQAARRAQHARAGSG